MFLHRKKNMLHESSFASLEQAFPHPTSEVASHIIIVFNVGVVVAVVVVVVLCTVWAPQIPCFAQGVHILKERRP